VDLNKQIGKKTASLLPILAAQHIEPKK